MLAEGRQLIQGYGAGGFKVGDDDHKGSIIVFPERTVPWPVSSPEEITVQSLNEALKGERHILLIGCGSQFTPPPPTLKGELKKAGVVLEWMDTGAACRTFNVLLHEDRQVTAALIAVD